MNTMNIALKALTCGFSALALTAVLGWSLVYSTASVPGASHGQVQMAKLMPQHLWFGQSQPAVLVD